jgi:hypothetical protein
LGPWGWGGNGRFVQNSDGLCCFFPFEPLIRWDLNIVILDLIFYGRFHLKKQEL